MLRYLALASVSITLAFLIFAISLFNISQPKYVFSKSPTPTIAPQNNIQIDYNISPDQIRQDNILWPVNAIKDQIWVTFAGNQTQKEEDLLDLANRRLADAQILFEEQNPELGVSTLTKAEKYLESAYNEDESPSFLQNLSIASLKHRQVIESLLPLAPDDAKPFIIQIENYQREVYKETMMSLNSLHQEVPQNPFDTL